MIAFVKGHGTENDFVLLPDADGEMDLDPASVRALCDRRAGIGGDGVLRVVRVAADAEAQAVAATQGLSATHFQEAPRAGDSGLPDVRWFMDHRNADGTSAAMCGNGIRVFGRFLVDAGWEQPGNLPVLTRSGVKVLAIPAAGDVTVDMGPARLPAAAAVAVPGADGAVARVAATRQVTFPGGAHALPAVEVDMGNPHVVVFLDDGPEADWWDLDAVDLSSAPVVEPPFPDGVNVELVVRRGARHVAMRVHERGVGETRSCGTGACAVMVASARRDAAALGRTTYVVDVPGGRLAVTESPDGGVELTGPAVLVATGEVDLAALVLLPAPSPTRAQ